MRVLTLVAVCVVVVAAFALVTADAQAYEFFGDYCWVLMPTNGGPNEAFGLKAKLGIFYMGNTHATVGGQCGVFVGNSSSSVGWGPCTGNLELVGNTLIGTLTAIAEGARWQGELVIDLGTLNGLYNSLFYAGANKYFSNGVMQFASCNAL